MTGSTKMLLMLALASACGDLGPYHARLQPLRAYNCIEDPVQICLQGTALVGNPPRDGTRFLVVARAPGALLIQHELFYPGDRVRGPPSSTGWRDNADSIVVIWRFTCPTCEYMYWKVWLPWTGDKVLDADSLLWRYE